MNPTDLCKLFSAGMAVMLLFCGHVGSAENEGMTDQSDAIYLVHPKDREAEQPDVPPAAAELANAFLTPNLPLKREPVDVFYVPNVDFATFPEDVTDRTLDAYRQRRAWRESIALDVQSTLLDLAEPHKQIANSTQLKKAIEKNSKLATFVQFCHLVLGEDSDNPDAMVKSVMQTFFSDGCRHTLVLEVGDGDQLQGFLMGTSRTGDDGKRVLVGLLIIWD